jgi:hypothetical protein
MTHLLLDEIYSVDVMDTRIKASFGTALKLFDHRKLGHSAAMAVATAAVYMVTPPTETFIEGMASRPMWTSLQQRLLPKDGWFGVDLLPRRNAAGQPLAPDPQAAARSTEGAPIVTGTLPDGAKDPK